MTRAEKGATAADRPRIEVRTRAELRAWLREHHASSTGAWIVTTKKSAGGTVAWNDIVEEALCFGWIDSLPRKVDETRAMLLLTPRKPKANWSAKNKNHVAELEERGLMHASGRAVVERSKKNGTWTALDEVSSLTIPVDLERAFERYAGARERWDAFPPSARRGILEWIGSAKRAETRAARIDETARLAKDGVRANQWPRPSVDSQVKAPRRTR